MFIYYFSHVPRPFEEVNARFLSLKEGAVAHAAEHAYEAGEAVRAEVKVGGGFKLSKEVLVTLHPHNQSPTGTVVPVSIHARGARSLFPGFEGEIEIAALGASLTQVGLRGTYRPPLGFVGSAIDRLLLHRVAEAAIKDLVDQLCGLLAAGRETKWRQEMASESLAHRTGVHQNL